MSVEKDKQQGNKAFRKLHGASVWVILTAENDNNSALPW